MAGAQPFEYVACRYDWPAIRHRRFDLLPQHLIQHGFL
jgi:hypothetical protein